MAVKNLKRRGSVVETKDGGFSVVNPRGSGFFLGDSVYWVWDSCDGSTSKKIIIDGFQNVFSVNKQESKELVESILNNLEELDLVSV